MALPLSFHFFLFCSESDRSLAIHVFSEMAFEEYSIEMQDKNCSFLLEKKVWEICSKTKPICYTKNENSDMKT